MSAKAVQSIAHASNFVFTWEGNVKMKVYLGVSRSKLESVNDSYRHSKFMCLPCYMVFAFGKLCWMEKGSIPGFLIVQDF